MSDSITIYSSPSCPQCRMIKMQLQAKGLEYQEVQDASKLAEKGITKIPTLEVNGSFYVGATSAFNWVKEK